MGSKKSELRKNVFEKFSGACAYCGQPIDRTYMQIDHVIPKYRFTHIVSGFKKGEFHGYEWLRHLSIEDVNHIENLFPSMQGM